MKDKSIGDCEETDPTLQEEKSTTPFHSLHFGGDCPMEKRVEWLNLPKELWLMITNHLTSTIDILRFRSTCNTWRSLLPLPSPPAHSLFTPQLRIPLGEFYQLLQTKTYRLEHQPHTHHQDPSFSSKGWIIKVGESKSIPLRLLDPFTNLPISHTPQRFPPNTSPKVLNLTNFRVVELTSAYTLNMRTRLLDDEEDEAELVFMSVHRVRKVVLFPSFQFHVEDRNRMVFVLQKDRKLGVSTIGDENWSFMDDGNMHYDDIILHKGQLYVVDKLGTILWIDCSSLKLVQFSPTLCGFGKKKQLVECDGSLYVVDMYIEGDPDNPMGMFCEVVDIKVYKLDEEWGRWIDVKNLGDVLFVLGTDSNFSLSAQDYYGCEGNCVYFYSEDKVWSFSLEDSTFKSPSTLFWPCPNLFHPRFNS